MKKKETVILALLIIAALIFASCAGAPPAATTTAARAEAATTATEAEPAAAQEGAEDAPPAGDAATDTEAAPEEPAASAEQAGGFNFSGYPMNESDQTITWWSTESYLPNSEFATANDSPFHTGLRDMLGVNIEWMFPTTGTDGTQAFNLMLASESLPDVICHPLMKDAARYMDEGTIWDLTPYMEEHSPAYWAWLHTNEDYDKSMKTDSGKYYGYGFFREAGGWNDTYLGPVVNQAWLEEQGLEMPVTISDWDNTLRVFKEKYGVALSFAKSRVQPTGISGAFGAYTMLDYLLYVGDGETVQLANVQPEYKKYLAKLHEWWAEGLLDQDYYTTDDTMARSNALNLKMGVAITSMGQVSNWEKDAIENETGAKWTGMQYPKGDDGTLSMVFGGRGIGTVAAVISTSCPEEKIPLVMRALDYAYTEEGSLYWNFGKQGVSWDYNADNEIEYLPLVTEDPNGLNNAIDKYGGSTWSGNCIQATLLLYLKNTKTAVDANDLWFYPNEPVTSYWKMPTGITLTADESTRNAELQAPIKTYVEEMAVKFINGEENLDNFDDFVATVEGMGLQEVLKINQAGLDRYIGR